MPQTISTKADVDRVVAIADHYADQVERLFHLDLGDDELHTALSGAFLLFLQDLTAPA